MTGSWKSGPIRYFHSVFTREPVCLQGDLWSLNTLWKYRIGPDFHDPVIRKNIFYFLELVYTSREK